ncbi:MAG: uroporphyrinogen decarboxylase [Pseudomonadota bacterium]
MPTTIALKDKAETRRFLKPFVGEAISPPPIWLMRQAGRYLPEYKKTRKETGSFLDLCYTPEAATEVTLQPIRRYGFDAAILFSDILVVPDALGQSVRFVEGEGPRLEPVKTAADLDQLDASKCETHLAPVFEAVSEIRAKLPNETALIGFCGAPWTVATYMVGGRGTPDQADARLWAYREPETFARLIDLLTETSIEYLSKQVEAGVDVLQIFDSWAGSLPEREFDRWVIAPTRRMVSELKSRHPDIPVIGFARGAGANLVHYANQTGIDGAGCDTAQGMAFARTAFEGRDDLVLQGNLDPLLVVAGGDELDRTVDGIIETMAGRPFVFNLGHGIVPQTPPENVARLVERIRQHT